MTIKHIEQSEIEDVAKMGEESLTPAIFNELLNALGWMLVNRGLDPKPLAKYKGDDDG